MTGSIDSYHRGHEAGEEQARKDMAEAKGSRNYHSNHPVALYAIGWYDGYCSVMGLEPE